MDALLSFVATSPSELLFENALAAHGSDLPAPLRQYHWCAWRRYRADYAWPEQRLMVEVQGGNWVAGRHARGSGLEKEYERAGIAATLGWRIVPLSTTMIAEQPALCLELVRQALFGRGEGAMEVRWPSKKRKKKDDQVAGAPNTRSEGD